MILMLYVIGVWLVCKWVGDESLSQEYGQMACLETTSNLEARKHDD